MRKLAQSPPSCSMRTHGGGTGNGSAAANDCVTFEWAYQAALTLLIMIRAGLHMF